MLTLNRPLKLEKVMEAMNVIDLMDETDVTAIASRVHSGYLADKSSRAEWEMQNAEAMRLCLQVAEAKTEPWAGAANVKFPLVTIAALHFHARAYPMLVQGVDIAKCRVIGTPTADKIARATRVGTHMSWQLIEQDEQWEAEFDKTLLVTGILGCCFKKSFFDPFLLHSVSQSVNPNDLVVDYWNKNDVNFASRATHRFNLTRNDIHERVAAGYFVKSETTGDGVSSLDPIQEAADRRQGITAPAPDGDGPVAMLEQLCWLDLDADGFAEPYIATVEEHGGKMRRLKARFVDYSIQYTDKGKKKVKSIDPFRIYSMYSLIPAPDGGFYPLGFGRLLGPINSSVNTMLNQLIDAGTLSNYGGGFLGRGARFRGGQYTFKPQEWKQVDSPGDDLRKNIVPLPVREPSAILLQLLTFLIGYGERVASANDMQQGENVGQNTPAETARTMNENGARVYAAIYKRIWRAFRDELRVRYDLNKYYLEVDSDYEDLAIGQGAMVHAADYSGPATDVRPAADPNMVDDTQRVQAAEMTMALALQMPGFKKYAAIRRVLEARKVPDIEELFPQPPPAEDGSPGDLPQPPDPKMLEVEVKQGLLQLKQQELQMEQQQFAIEQQRLQMELQVDMQRVQSEMQLLQAQAAKAYAEAEGVQTGHMVSALQSQVAGKEVEMRQLELQAAQTQTRVDSMLAALKIRGDQVKGKVDIAVSEQKIKESVVKAKTQMALGQMKIQEKAGDVAHKREVQSAQRAKQSEK